MKYQFIISTLFLFNLNAYANPLSVVYQDGLVEYTCHKPTPTNPDLQNAAITCLFHDNGNIAEIAHQGKVGLINKDGNLITKIKYDKIESYHDNLTAQVKLNDKYGLINTKTGKELTPIHFDKMHSFSQNRMAVSLHGKSGYIDGTGQMVITPKYGNAYNFENGLAIVSNNKNAKDGTYRMGVIDLSGKEIAPPIYRYISFSDDNLIYFSDELKYFGVMNNQGNIIINPAYPDMGIFNHGFATVSLTRDLKGYINESDQEIITPQYQNAKTPAKIGNKIIFIVAKNSKHGLLYGAIDKDSNILIDFNYHNLNVYEPADIIVATDKNNNKLLLNHEFKPITEAIYHDFIYFDKNTSVYNKNGKYGFIHLDGKEITQPLFEGIKLIYSQKYTQYKAHTTHYGYAVRIGDKWGFYSMDGKSLLPIVYDDIINWNDDNLFIKKDNRYGKSDSSGNIITPPVYENYRPLTHGYLKAKIDNTWYLISPTGENLGKTSKPNYAD